jgi:predicted neutral ceramidase superfamily lipid hydrolase
MDWERFLVIFSGITITLALTGQLRYEGIYNIPQSISPFAAIGLFAAVASLLVWGILAHSIVLSVVGSIGLVMSLLLIRTAFKAKGNINRKDRI